MLAFSKNGCEMKLSNVTNEAMKDKLAEEIKNILSQIIIGEDADGNPYHFGQDGSEINQAIKLLSPLFEAYHEAKLREITDEDIDVHVIEHYVLSSVPFCLAFTNGAKAFRNGEIKHIKS